MSCGTFFHMDKNRWKTTAAVCLLAAVLAAAPAAGTAFAAPQGPGGSFPAEGPAEPDADAVQGASNEADAAESKTAGRTDPDEETDAVGTVPGTQAASLADMTEDEILELVGPICTADQQQSGILASVTLAQFILESGFGKSELAQNANNLFGMKASLSGNQWDGSAWDGVSTYRKGTGEWNGSGYFSITANFRKYPDIEHSIQDHSSYLLSATRDGAYRYEGLSGCSDHREAIRIIVSGGYCTSPTYLERILELIDKWDLKRFDVMSAQEYVAPLISANGGSFIETIMNEEGLITRGGAESETQAGDE